MKHKTETLEGELLDRAVAMAVGSPDFIFEPSTDWRDGGGMIESERILICSPHEDAPADRYWQAVHPKQPNQQQLGPTPLIAAMRAYVASKLGKEVELP